MSENSSGQKPVIIKTSGSQKPDLKFYYDAAGRRIMKRVIPKTGAAEKTEFYAHDAQGNTLTIYSYIASDTATYKVSEQMIYGSSRLGTWKSGIDLLAYIPAEPEILVTDRGSKQYEMNDHLGNVHAVVSDRKKRICDEGEFAYYEADIRSTYDYYAFGMMMPGRDHSAPVCSLVPDTGYVQLVYDTFTTSAPGWLYLSDFSSPNLSGGEMVFDRGISDILFKSISGSAHGKKYRVSFDVELNGCDSIGFAGDLDSAQVTTFTVSGSHNFEFTSTGFYTGIFIILSDSCGASFDNVLVEEMVFGTTTLCKPQDSYRFAFNGKEKVDEVYGDANAYDFGARLYDPRLGRWLAVDPLAYEFPWQSPYTGFDNNPIIHIDPDGKATVDHIDVTQNKDGSYTVVGGQANSDKNIYVVDSKGKRTGEVVGEMLTEYSFHKENGEAVVGANINLKDQSGQTFFNKEIKDVGLIEYMNNAKGNELYDFKTRDMPAGLTREERGQYTYRGMMFNGKVASARDIGNYAAGYVAGVHGMGWEASRAAFDALESYQKKSFATEGQPTQRAQKLGHNNGYYLFKQRKLEKEWRKATNQWPTGVKY